MNETNIKKGADTSPLCTSVTLLDSECEKDASAEYLLPDYIDGAEKVLITSVVTNIDDTYFDSGKIGYEGRVTFNVIILTEAGELKSISFDEEFDGKTDLSVPDGISADELSYSVTADNESSVCRLTGPKKLNAKCRLNIKIHVSYMKTVTPVIDNKSALPISSLMLERLNEPVSALHSALCAENGIQFSDDIELGGNFPQIDEIIVCNVKIIPEECKLSDGDIVFRGSVNADCIYKSPAGSYHTVSSKFPISESFERSDEIPNIPDASLYVTVTEPEVSAVAVQNSFGEKRTIELDFTYDLEINCLYNGEALITRDIYSVTNPSCAEYGDVELARLFRVINGNVSVNAKEKHMKNDSSDGGEGTAVNTSADVPTVIYSTGSIKKYTVEADDEKGKMIVAGSADIQLIVTDGNSLRGMNMTVPFKNELDLYGISGKITSIVNLYLSQIHTRSDTEFVYADFDVIMTSAVISSDCERVIEKLTINPADEKSTEKCPSILIYYPNEDELIWDIAKKYGTTVSSLTSANNIKGDRASGDSVLIIPKKQ